MDKLSCKIMIVDDSVAFLRLFMESMVDSDDKDILDRVIFCGSVDDALREYAIHRPLIVLMDIKMPGRNGIEGAQLLRKIDPNAHIVFLSNYPSDPTAAKAVEERIAIGVLDKAVGTGVLASIVSFVVKLGQKAIQG